MTTILQFLTVILYLSFFSFIGLYISKRYYLYNSYRFLIRFFICQRFHSSDQRSLIKLYIYSSPMFSSCFLLYHYIYFMPLLSDIEFFDMLLSLRDSFKVSHRQACRIIDKYSDGNWHH